jgi:hypothetical protein
VKHGDPTPDVPLDVWLGPDPSLALAEADMDAWLDAHPCNCEALCECPWTQADPGDEDEDEEMPDDGVPAWV